MDTSGALGSPERLRAVVVKPHQATDDMQLSLQLDEVIIVLEQDESGWWGGHKDGEELTGWFPGSCVRQVQADPLQWPSVSPVPAATEAAAPGDEDSFENTLENQMRNCSTVLQGPTGQASVAGDCAAGEALQSPQDSCSAQQSPSAQSVRVRLVATPQRTSLGGNQQRSSQQGLATAAEDLAASTRSAEVSALAAETAQLQSRISELSAERDQLQGRVAELSSESAKLQATNNTLRQQAEAESQRALSLELGMRQEKESKQQIEDQLKSILQGGDAEKTNLRAEVAAARGLLDDERRRREEAERARESVEAELCGKADELRALQESSRRALAAERERARGFEESARAAEEELRRRPSQVRVEPPQQQQQQQQQPRSSAPDFQEDFGRGPRGSQPIAQRAPSTPTRAGSICSVGGRPRSDSAPGLGAIRHPNVSQDEAPRRGCVAERVRDFEQRSATPRRDSATFREGRASSHSAIGAEDRRHRRTPPMPRQGHTPTGSHWGVSPVHTAGASGADLREEAANVFMGMSPISGAGQESPPLARQQWAHGSTSALQHSGEHRPLPGARAHSATREEVSSDRVRMMQVW